ncbi:hypothetical protein [Corynebacterium ulcerans]|uniref:hypothetical protein n=1 Tax=Corynebacterium ulcerans TaxID=65058 RepID=UPI0002141648|nr:hypothetical protein [Corynebacterium ulcerans]AEG83394.1 hypothetical protein CULC22_00681 [Corynebacterium ulcerans BR-AD22]MBH5298510.1 hypothetical protein [Corynebacterium ulcerans]NOL58666.1 hypothetical protein [Corynebacterium ulcerans]NOM02206.1 hypothetical protein [Corynebacterium ulcerans]
MIENLLIGVVSGVISGFIVAACFWFASYKRKPPLELIHVAENRAVLKNNRLRPVVVGGAWEMGNGNVFYRPDGFRGGDGGFYIPRFGEFIVGTTHFKPGQTADIAYKYVNHEKDPTKRIWLEESNTIDVSEVVIHPKKYPDWKLDRVLLKGFA